MFKLKIEVYLRKDEFARLIYSLYYSNVSMSFFDSKIDFLFLCAHCTSLSSQNRIDVLMCALTQLDRDTIRRNEFGWVLQSKVADLASDDLLPPRFHDLAPSFASMNSINRSPVAEALSSAGSTMRTASFSLLGTPRQEPPLTKVRNSGFPLPFPFMDFSLVLHLHHLYRRHL